jgi:Ca2+-binding RTX toxin-like protein
VVIGGLGGDTVTAGGADASLSIAAGDGARDVVVGDNGTATFAGGALDTIATTVFGIGGADTIRTGGGSDVVLGGAGGDTILADLAGAATGDDVVLGDEGQADFDAATGAPVLVESLSHGTGGSDVIRTGDGADLVIAGFGADQVFAGGADAALGIAGPGDGARDVVVGDSGRAVLTAGALDLVETTGDAGGTQFGDADLVRTGNGSDVVLGGSGADQIFADESSDPSGADLVLGDNGSADFDAASGLLLSAASTATSQGGDDEIHTGDGADVVVGGFGADTITAGGADASLSIAAGDGARDVVVGDSGRADFVAGVLRELQTTGEDLGGADTIRTGGGDDRVLAGTGGDAVQADQAGDDGEDVVFGDNGRLVFDASSALTLAETRNPARAGADDLRTGDGADLVFGGSGDDVIVAGGPDLVLGIATGDDARDVVLGDDGVATLPGGLMVELRTTDPAYGGDDVIRTGDGADWVLGGSGGDEIDAETSADADAADVVLGDSGRITFGGTAAFGSGEAGSTLSFNFTGSSGPDVTGVAGAPGAAAGGWNNLEGGYDLVGDDLGETLLFDDGSFAAGVAIEYGRNLATSPGAALSDTHSELNPVNDDGRLFEGYLYTSTSDLLNARVTGLAAHYASYDVWVYVDADNGQSASSISSRAISNGTTTYYLNDPDGNTFAGTYVQVTSTSQATPQIGNYVVFTGLTADELFLTIDNVGASTANRPALAGLQIVGQHHAIDRIETLDPEYGGNDVITTGSGADVVFGGAAHDDIDTAGPAVRGRFDADVVVGDNGRATFAEGELRDVDTTDPQTTLAGGRDDIRTGTGRDLVLGGFGNDTIDTAASGPIDNGDVRVLSLNFNGEDDGVVTGVAGAVQAGNWNNLENGDQTDDDDDGSWDEPDEPDVATGLVFHDASAATGVVVTWGEDFEGNDPDSTDDETHSQIDPQNENESLFGGYVTTHTYETLQARITGLAAHYTSPYDVYVYLDADDADSSSTPSIRKLSDGTTTFYLNDPDGHHFQGQFVEVTASTPGGAQLGNYVVFRNVSGNEFFLEVDDYGTSQNNRPALTAIQVVGGSDKDAVVIGGDFEQDRVVGDQGVARLLGGSLYELASTDFRNPGSPPFLDADTITTGDGADIVIGGNDSDALDGGSGDDLLLGDNARVLFFGGVADEPELLADLVGGHDRLTGGFGDDLLYGQFGNDTFRFVGLGLGHDEVFESDGSGGRPNDLHDRLDFSQFGTDIEINLQGDDDDDDNFDDDFVFWAHGELDLDVTDRLGIEDVTGTLFDDEIRGNTRDNTLLGLDDDDVLDGRDGDDLLIGGAGNDWIDGDDHDDLIDGGPGNDILYANLEDEDDDDDGDGGDDYSPPDRNVVLGGPGQDTVFGSRVGRDLISGEGENDYLDGQSGDDVILGGDGNDTLLPGSGADVLEGGPGTDTLVQENDWWLDARYPEQGPGLLGLRPWFDAFDADYDLDRFFFVDPNEGNPTPVEDRPVRPWVFDFLTAVETDAYDPLPAPLQGDLNFDGLVDNADFLIFQAELVARIDSGTGSDLNHDGVVNIDDFNILLPLILAGTSVMAAEPAPAVDEVGVLTQEALAPIVAEAVRSWEVALGEELSARLAGVQFQIADLEGLRLGQAVGTTVWLDRDGAGHGWFVDATPATDREFRPVRTGDVLVARPGGPAAGRMDLLSVVTHELGHVLGFVHEDEILRGAVQRLPDTLEAGTRIVPGHEGSVQRKELRARVSRSAELAKDVWLGERVQVHAQVRIGEGSVLGADSVIGRKARLGARVWVGDGAVIEPGAVVPDDSVVPAGSRVQPVHDDLRAWLRERSGSRAQPDEQLRGLARLFGAERSGAADEQVGDGPESARSWWRRLLN